MRNKTGEVFMGLEVERWTIVDFRKPICVEGKLEEENPEKDETEPANLNGNRKSVPRKDICQGGTVRVLG